MPINNFFNLYNNKAEQNLIEDLLNESIKMMGFDAYYIPNVNQIASDLLYGDDPLKKFDSAYPVEVYLSNSVDPGMNNDFFSKFGLEIKNSVRIQLPRRAFAKRVPQDTHSRPKEGDLVYIPFLSGTGELYEIKYVNDSSDYFTLGRRQPYYWELELELFKYSNENIDTGVDVIDVVEEINAFAIDYNLGSGSGDYKLREIVYQGNIGSPSSFGTVQEWNAPNKILKLNNIVGDFSANTAMIGSDSGASYILLEYDALDIPKGQNAWDNRIVETEIEPILDTSEENPFGIL